MKLVPRNSAQNWTCPTGASRYGCRSKTKFKEASMGVKKSSRSAQIRARVNHPIIDSDGHTLEFVPAYLDYLKQVGGSRIRDGFAKRMLEHGDQWYKRSASERAETRTRRSAWWGVPTRNTLDRVTPALPRLLHERLQDIGLDFAVIYPSIGLGMVHIGDEELRRAACRALNVFHADTFREYADRMTPVAAIPMHTPTEAIEEMEYAVGHLGMKAIVMASYVLRPLASGHGHWYDALCLDSAHDYDPVWAKCQELRVTPTFHSSTQGLGTRASISNYMYNHIGHFAVSGEALCKAAFMGGVCRRFPDLRMAFLEGGVGWACSLYSDLIGHWKKRNRSGMENYDPRNLDQDLFLELHRRYGGKMVEGKLEDKESRELAMFGGTSFFGASQEDPATLDEFARCEISRPEDIRDVFTRSFYFGCEADDPINAWAFDAKKNPYGARLGAIFSSDIGHWDVEDINGVVEEAYELVEDGLITENDFRDFVFANPLKMWTHMNPDFFKGTSIEDQARSYAT